VSSDPLVRIRPLTVCTGVIGLVKDSDQIIDTSFDILSLEALFMVPRYLLFSDLR
jgi:hypothetical protein